MAHEERAALTQAGVCAALATGCGGGDSSSSTTAGAPSTSTVQELIDRGDSVVMVLRHGALPLALTDSVWAKYKLGEVFKIEDPDTKAPAVRNPFYLKPGALPVPDAALQKLIARGVKVGACNLAITFYSGMVAQKTGMKHEDVKKDWTDAVLPGIQVVPSGVVACNGAVSRGCAYVFAG